MRETVALAIAMLLTSQAVGEVSNSWGQAQSPQNGLPAAVTGSAEGSGVLAPGAPADSGSRPGATGTAPVTAAGSQRVSVSGFDSTDHSAAHSADRSTDPAPAAKPHDSGPSPTYNPAFGSRLVPGPDYVIGIGDVLRISVWKEPDFSSTVQVRSDGMISIPLLNDLPVVGYKPMQLRDLLTEKLRKYADDPRVTVIVSQAGAPTFYLVGEVGRKGPMTLAPNMTILQALLTVGLTTFANTKKIYVLRMENGVEKKIRVNYKQMLKGQGMNQNLVLQAGDMVVVP